MWVFNPNEERQRWADMMSDDSDTDIRDPVFAAPIRCATVPKGGLSHVGNTWQSKKRGDRESKPWVNKRDNSQWRQRRPSQTTVAPASPMGSMTTVEDTSPHTDSSQHTDASPRIDSFSQTCASSQIDAFSQTFSSSRIDAFSQTSASMHNDRSEWLARQALERTLEEERVRHSDQTERLMVELDNAQQDFENEKTRFRQDRQTWEHERTKLCEEMAASNTRIEREVTDRVTARFESELRVKAEATENMRTSFEEENRELRDALRGSSETLKQVRKDHNAQVQKLQAKVNAALARSAQTEKKAERKHIEVQCDPCLSVDKFQELNRKLIQKLQESIRQKNDLEEQVRVMDKQLDQQSDQNGAQSRKIKDLEKRIREALVHKRDAVVSAERFHEQNKGLLLERKTFAAQVQSLQKQVNWHAWNNKVLDMYGSAKNSVLIRPEESGSTTFPTRSNDTDVHEDIEEHVRNATQ